MKITKISQAEARRFLLSDGQSARPLPNGKAYVYVIRSMGGGPVKIGLAVSPELRMAELQCGNPHELRLVALIAPQEVMALTVERKAHALASFAHERGEWFNLDALEAVACVLTACAELGATPLAVDEVPQLVEEHARTSMQRSEGQRRQHLRRKLGLIDA